MKLAIQHFKIIKPLSKIVEPTVKQLSTSRVNALLLNVPRVQLSSGKNNYLLMMIHLHGKTRYGRTIVRGADSKSHGLYDSFTFQYILIYIRILYFPCSGDIFGSYG